jgi:hypothetical protein
LTASVIANIETGRRDEQGRRRRDVTVDEVVALAAALEEPVASLLGLAVGEGDPELLNQLQEQVKRLERLVDSVQRSRIIGPGVITARRAQYAEPPWPQPEEEGSNG